MRSGEPMEKELRKICKAIIVGHILIQYVVLKEERNTPCDKNKHKTNTDGCLLLGGGRCTIHPSCFAASNVC